VVAELHVKAIIAGHTPELVGCIQQMCAAIEIQVLRTLDRSNPTESLERVAASLRPQIVFLEINESSLPGALDLLRQLQFGRDEIMLVGFALELGPVQHSAVESGIWQILVPPFDDQEFFQTVRGALRQQRTDSTVHGFIPAKGGAGATVTALNIATCLGHFLKKKVLLIEADFYSGILPLLLKFSPTASVMDALENSERLDERTWTSMVTKRHGIDILAAWGARSAGQDSPLNFDRLLGFVRQRYDNIIVDLPVVVDRVAEVVSYHAKGMFVVSTPEPICMDVARRRLRQLEAHGARSSTLGVVLNRVSSELNMTDCGRLLGGNICGVLPNDYKRVQEAMAAEKPVDPSSPLGNAYRTLAFSIAGVEASTERSSGGLGNLLRRLTGGEEKRVDAFSRK
jgi:Flp pilus assembly CpaE family ATPase